MSEVFLRALLEQLADNRQFPKYQYERRIDILINFFLPDVLRKRYGFNTTLLVPEFPVRKSVTNYSSNNIDYLAYGDIKGQPHGYIVELKTDADSVKTKQLAYYKKVMDALGTTLKQEISEIGKKSKQHGKYRHLLKRIKDIPDEAMFDAIYLAPKCAESKFIKARDLICGDLRDRWLFMSLEDFASTEIQTRYPDAWTALSEHIALVLKGPPETKNNAEGRKRAKGIL